MRRIVSAIAVAVTAAAFAGGAAAQSSLPLSLEVRGGLPFPTGELSDVGEDIGDGLGPGYTVGGSLIFSATPQIGIYGGYTFTHFQVEDFDGIGLNTDGFDAGVRFALPTTTGLAPWIKGGVVYHDAEVVFDEDVQVDPDDVDVSDNELGFEIGGGVEVPLGRRLSFTPGVSYVRFSTDAAFQERDVSYVKADVGLRIRL